MRSTTVLGEYLRARRALVRPQDVGLSGHGRRRVPGLRREELATIAGISSDYYLRLEQGRDQNPSSQVIDALARALRLDRDATTHLHALARRNARAPNAEECERAPSSIEALIASWPTTPAVVVSRFQQVLASNPLAVALTPIFTPGINLVRAVFLDPEVRKIVPDWEALARQAVARLRALAGPDVDHPRLIEMAEDLSAHSDDFRRLWGRHDVVLSNFPVHSLNHGVVGRIELQAEWLQISGTERQWLLVYHAEAGSSSERALSRLQSIAAA